MNRIPTRARRRAPSTFAAAVAFALLAAGCVKGPPDQSDAKVAITATQPGGTYSPGDDVTFRMTLTNTGDRDIGNLSIEAKLDSHLRASTLRCAGLVDAPTNVAAPACSYFMYPVWLPKGASVTIDVTATVADGAPGSLDSSFTATVVRGPGPAAADSKVAVVDTRSGAYTAWTSDGRQSDLAADFSSRTLSFSNPDLAFGGAFQAAAAGDAGFRFDSHTGFMQRPGLLAGNVAVGGSPRVFVAARTFVTQPADLDGRDFNVFSIDTAAGGASTSRFATARFAGPMLTFCDEPAPHAIGSCPAASTHAYVMTASGNGFTALDATTGDTIHFQVARVGATMLLLRGEASGAGRTFAVGLEHRGDLFDAQYAGGDTAGRWSSLALHPDSLDEDYTADDGSIVRSMGDLSAIDGVTVVSGALGANAIPVWVGQDESIAVVMARPGSSQDGLLQLFMN